MTSHPQYRAKKRGLLVIHPGALGDVLLARPVLLSFRDQFPQHEIALLAGESVGMLLCYAGEVDRIFSLESRCSSELFAGVDSLQPAFKTWLGNCDIAVGWLQDTGKAICETLRATEIEQVCLKSTSSPELLAEHQAARYLEAVMGGGIMEMPNRPLLIQSDLRERGRQVLHDFNWNRQQQLALIHPGSGSSHKCLDAPRIARVIEWLSQAGMTPMLLEGPADRELAANVLADLSIAVPVLRGLTLSTAAGVLSHADLYLGHDSGVTHLAAALSVPTIACFGPTNPRRWSPLGPIVSILSGPPCACPTWNNVEGCRDRVCLRITPERIIEACRALMVR